MKLIASRGRVWFDRLTGGAAALAGFPPSVLVADAMLDAVPVRWICVVPDSNARFPRARNGEVGIDEGFAIARAVQEARRDSAIVAIVDVPGQAFGIREEAIGLQRALAASVGAYAKERRSGRRVAALVVGKAISGAFLAHGMQAGWIGAIDDPGIEVHVMSAPAVARVTRMNAGELDRIALEIPATARDIRTFATLGAIDALFTVADPLNPTERESAAIAESLAQALHDPHLALRAPHERSQNAAAQQTRQLARRVREAVAESWDA
jgi:biotin-independent malonate decarboxylase gamma subunit